jgi:hypothetical protein
VPDARPSQPRWFPGRLAGITQVHQHGRPFPDDEVSHSIAHAALVVGDTGQLDQSAALDDAAV